MKIPSYFTQDIEYWVIQIIHIKGKELPQGEIPCWKALPASCSVSEHLKTHGMTFNYPFWVPVYPKNLVS
jgi:hypothetical protein